MRKKIIGICVLMLLFMPIFAVPATTLNQEPSTPIIEGPCETEFNVTCYYTVYSIDPQGDDIYYKIGYSDDPSIKIRQGPFKSGDIITIPHKWDDVYQDYNPFFIKVMAIDEDGHESNWSRFDVNVTNAKIGKLRFNNDYGNLLLKTSILQLFVKLIDRFPLLERLFNI